MRRHAFAAAVLLIAPALAGTARATPVTAYALGWVTARDFEPAPSAGIYEFAIGERIYLTVTYDLDPGPVPPPATARIAVDLRSQYGFHKTFLTRAPVDWSTGSESGGVLDLRLAVDPYEFALTLNDSPGESGLLSYVRSAGVGAEGFRAGMIRVADANGFAMPEPSTLAMGLVGSTLAGLGLLRKRAVR